MRSEREPCADALAPQLLKPNCSPPTLHQLGIWTVSTPATERCLGVVSCASEVRSLQASVSDPIRNVVYRTEGPHVREVVAMLSNRWKQWTVRTMRQTKAKLIIDLEELKKRPARPTVPRPFDDNMISEAREELRFREDFRGPAKSKATSPSAGCVRAATTFLFLGRNSTFDWRPRSGGAYL